MRKVRLCMLILASIFVFSSCSVTEGENKASEIRKMFSQYGSVSVKAEVTADYGEKVFVFGVKYEGNADGGKIQILSPENIAGITANVKFDEKIKLEFDGMVLDTGNLDPDGLSPVSALPNMLLWWREGYTKETSDEKFEGIRCISQTVAVSDEETLRTWFDRETLLPLHAEIIYRGYTVIACDFENISMN